MNELANFNTLFTVFDFKKETLPNGSVVFHLKGIFDGAIDLARIISPVPERLIVNCSRIIHVNSSGIQPWMLFFSQLRQDGVQFSFSECPNALIEYFNAIPNFNCGGKVESVATPFFCEKCNHEITIVLKTEEIRANLDKVLMTQKCPSCNKVAVFDDDPDDFFLFMKAKS